MLDGEKAQRADVSRRLADMDKRATLGDYSQAQERSQLEATRQKLSAQVNEAPDVSDGSVLEILYDVPVRPCRWQD